MLKILRQSTLISLFFISCCSSTNTNSTRVLVKQDAPGGLAGALTSQVSTREVHTVNLGFMANVVCAVGNENVSHRAYANDADDTGVSWSGVGAGDEARLFSDNHVFEGMSAQISATNRDGTRDLPYKEVRLDSLSAVADTCGWKNTNPVYKAFGFADSTDGSFEDVLIVFAIDTI